ncbi:hypothetical protein [uncultured Shimia sp.]|uniref:CBU_0592 family membrane protein n=1 Tax=uncultured Shimia sp. TaxID=573152 RepID=UPI002638A0C6|nr:hypothetical protein [uncultured Shimia sp.]
MSPIGDREIPPGVGIFKLIEQEFIYRGARLLFAYVFELIQALPKPVSTACGVLGFCLYLTNYTLITFRILSSQDIPFFVINIFGAGLVLVSLVQDFNLGSFMIQVFWICLGVIAIVVRVKSRAAWRREVHRAPLSPALGAPHSR